MSAKQKIQRLLASADVAVGGNRPWDIQVHDQRAYKCVLSRGTLGMGEAYMDGWWDANDLAAFVCHVAGSDIEKRILQTGVLLQAITSHIFNMQRFGRHLHVAKKHYDPHLEVYRRMLDESMAYTCAYYGSGAKSLAEAQAAKHDLICRKLGVKEGDRVLDIGCGWGAFLRYAVEYYGARGFGVSISEEQTEVARCMSRGYGIDYQVQDYHTVYTNEPFDHVVSIGMFEHTGYRNHRAYMRTVRRVLKPDGLSMLHTIGGNRSRKYVQPFIEKHFFPNSMIPSLTQIGRAAEGEFVIEDVHNFGSDYDTTLCEWHKRLKVAWPEISHHYDVREFRKWEFYLLGCAGVFRARALQLYQVVLSPNGVPCGYTSIR